MTQSALADRPPISIRVSAGHSVNGALPIAERMRVEVPAGSMVVINHAKGIDVARDEIRGAISIQIRRHHSSTAYVLCLCLLVACLRVGITSEKRA
jgi:hypothetical protein